MSSYSPNDLVAEFEVGLMGLVGSEVEEVDQECSERLASSPGGGHEEG